jgi:cytochrome b involved in lipid metabolism
MEWMRVHATESPPGPLRDDITAEELARHSTPEDMWMALRGKVYNVTPYLRFHPGGEKILLSVAGKDGTAAFERYHRWVNIPALIGRLQIGTMKPG